MPDKPTTANTQDLAETEYDAERWAQVGTEQQSVPSANPTAPSDSAQSRDVGLAQKGADEEAVVKRETDI